MSIAQESKPVAPEPISADTKTPHPLLNVLVTEFIGTFALAFTVVAVTLQKQQLAPLAIGAALMVSVYAGGHISGGHYNPAVSFAVFLRRRLTGVDMLRYWTVQILGAVAAAVVARIVVNPASVSTTTLAGRGLVSAAVGEFVFTFLLAFVVLNVATSKDHPNNSFYGLAVGFTVLTGAVAVGSISGGAFNPAIALGGGVSGLFAWSTIWVYPAACLLAGAAAAGAFIVLNPNDR